MTAKPKAPLTPYKKGRLAHKHGIGRNNNPYHRKEDANPVRLAKKKEWLRGWDARAKTHTWKLREPEPDAYLEGISRRLDDCIPSHSIPLGQTGFTMELSRGGEVLRVIPPPPKQNYIPDAILVIPSVPMPTGKPSINIVAQAFHTLHADVRKAVGAMTPDGRAHLSTSAKQAMIDQAYAKLHTLMKAWGMADLIDWTTKDD